MTTIFNLPVEILMYISEFIPEPVFWKFFRDSNKVFKETLPPRKNNRELFQVLLGLEKCGYPKDVKKFLKKHGFIPEFQFYEKLIETKNLSCIKYLKHIDFFNEHQEIFYEMIVKCDHLFLLFWFVDNKIGDYCCAQLCDLAVKYEKLEILKWTRIYKCPWDKTIWETAMQTRNFEILKWLKENNCPVDESIYRFAIKTDDLGMLKWLKKNNFPWNESICTVATKRGNLEMLKWLRKHDCPWDDSVCVVAVKRGNLEILEFAWETDYLHSRRVFKNAKKAGHKKVIKWLKENCRDDEKKWIYDDKCAGCSDFIDLDDKNNRSCGNCCDNSKIYCKKCLTKCQLCFTIVCHKCIIMSSGMDICDSCDDSDFDH